MGPLDAGHSLNVVCLTECGNPSSLKMWDCIRFFKDRDTGTGGNLSPLKQGRMCGLRDEWRQSVCFDVKEVVLS
eukprot:11320537-Ditylum_brightwellii.AAC.1